MLRRSFRFGLRVGVVVGLFLAAAKLWQARQAAEPDGEGWADDDRSWRPPPAPVTPPTPSGPARPGPDAPAPHDATAARAPVAADPAAAVGSRAAGAKSPATDTPATDTTATDTTATEAPATKAPAKRSAAKAPAAKAPAAKAPAAKAPAARSATGAGTAASAKAPAGADRVGAPGGDADGAGGAARLWVTPVGATCPPDHPVKVKLASRLFHVPGMFAYDRTRPDRCYADEDQAVAEGFSRAKR